MPSTKPAKRKPPSAIELAIASADPTAQPSLPDAKKVALDTQGPVDPPVEAHNSAANLHMLATLFSRHPTLCVTGTVPLVRVAKMLDLKPKPKSKPPPPTIINFQTIAGITLVPPVTGFEKPCHIAGVRAVYCVARMAEWLTRGGITTLSYNIGHFVRLANVAPNISPQCCVNWLYEKTAKHERPLFDALIATMKRDDIDPEQPALLQFHLQTSDGVLQPMAPGDQLGPAVSDARPHHLTIIVTSAPRLRECRNIDPGGDKRSIAAIAWLDDSHFVTAGTDPDLHIWNVDGRHIHRIANASPQDPQQPGMPVDCVHLAWSKSRCMLAAACGTQVAFWTRTASQTWCRQSVIADAHDDTTIAWILWGPDDAYVLTGASGTPIYAWGIDGRPLFQIHSSTGCWHAALTPIGSKLVEVGADAAIHTLNPDPTKIVSRVVPVRESAGSWNRASWSPDGTVCLATNEAGIYSIAGSQPVYCVESHDSMLHCDMAWHPDSSLFVVAACGEGGIELRRKTGELVSSTRAFSCGRSVAWSPDGTTVAAQVFEDGNVYIKLFKVC